MMKFETMDQISFNTKDANQDPVLDEEQVFFPEPRETTISLLWSMKWSEQEAVLHLK